MRLPMCSNTITHAEVTDLVVQLRKRADMPNELRSADIAQRFERISRRARDHRCGSKGRDEAFQHVWQMVRMELEPFFVRLCQSAVTISGFDQRTYDANGSEA